MKQITQIGATTEEAISLALQKLGVTREQVRIDILQEGKKGFLGFGTKPAEISVTLIDAQVDSEPVPIVESAIEEVAEPSVIIEEIDPLLHVGQYVRNIAYEMGATDVHVEVTERGKQVYFQIESEKAALLIGKRGQTLNAFQQLAQLMLNETVKQYKIAVVNVGNYREQRIEALEQLAVRTADRVAETGVAHKFEPMPSYERKAMHNVLASRLDVETYSEGAEQKRYLVIEKLQ